MLNKPFSADAVSKICYKRDSRFRGTLESYVYATASFDIDVRYSKAADRRQLWFAESLCDQSSPGQMAY